MSSPVRYGSGLEESLTVFPDIPGPDASGARCKSATPFARATNRFTALSFEFVAKPEQAAAAPLFLPAAIQSGLENITGFAGSLVMVSDQEARLITVIIFWNGMEARRSCDRSVRRVRALLAPYLDRCLRAQNLSAHLPKARDFPQPSSIDRRFITEESITDQSNPERANVCAA